MSAEHRKQGGSASDRGVVMYAHASVVLFLASLLFPCFTTELGEPDWSLFQGDAVGYLLLLYGWLGMFDGELA